MNSGNIKKIDIDGVILNQAYPEYKGNPNKQDAQPGTKWTINVELKGSAQSGDTFGLILKDFTEKRHIATGSESKTIYFVEDPESVTFTDKGAEALSIYTKEITIDNLKFHLNKELPLTKITLENIGTLPSTGIKEVYINGEKATASENSFTVEKSFTVKNDDSIPVKVTFNTPIQSGTTIQFKLTGLADGRHIELGTVSKILTFIDNPALEQKITIGGTLANDILAQNEVIQDTFKVYFNNVPTDQSITLKKITFQKTGTMNTDQTSFSLSKGSEIYGNNTKLTNGKMSISFENGLKLQSGSTFNLNDIIKNTPNSGETIAFQIIDFEIAEDNILTGVEKEGYTRTLTVTEKLVTLETVKDGDKTVKTATEIILDKITPKLIGIGSDKAEIVLKKLGSLPMENIESIKLGNTQTTADRNDQDQTFTLKNINLTNGGNLELRVKLKNPSNIKNNSDLRFRLDSFKNESDASTGFVEGKKDTNKLIFNNPKINVFGEGKENTGDITDQTFNLGKLSINIDGTEKVTLKTLTLRQEGTTSYKDIKNLQLVEESSNYNATQKEGIFTFNFGENGKPISQNTTLIVKGELNSPIDNRTLRFTIDNYTLAEDIKDEEKEKTPNTTKSITYSSPVVTIAGNSGNVVSDAKENITLDKLKIETKNTSSTVIKTIKLEKIGNI
ncbi:hypothetical protein IJM86_05655 [bacterium]|nr:hypothetical protein [bacterium]